MRKLLRQKLIAGFFPVQSHLARRPVVGTEKGSRLFSGLSLFFPAPLHRPSGVRIRAGKNGIALLPIDRVALADDEIPLRHIQIKLKLRGIRNENLQRRLHFHRDGLFKLRKKLLKNDGKIISGNVAAVLLTVLHEKEKAQRFSENALVHPANDAFLRKIQIMLALHMNETAQVKDGSVRFLLQRRPEIRHFIPDDPALSLAP